MAAVTLAIPVETDVARPDESTLAISGLLTLHLTDWVKSLLLPSLNVPVALNWAVCPRAMLEVPGATTSAVRCEAPPPVIGVVPHATNDRMDRVAAVAATLFTTANIFSP
jgi:hypothetical protein